MVCAYSRWLLALLIASRTAADLFAGWWQLIGGLGGGAAGAGVGRRGRDRRWRAGRVELTAAGQAFRGTLGAKVVVCKPSDPEAKGLIERAHDYLERSFLPGCTFADPMPGSQDPRACCQGFAWDDVNWDRCRSAIGLRVWAASLAVIR